MGMISRTAAAVLVASMALASAAAGCTAGSTSGLDGGPEGSAPLGEPLGEGGSVPDGAPDGGPSTSDGSAGLDFCTRQTDLDTDCAAAFGTTAPHGYACSDVFTHAPPCQALSSRGCTEICANRCCP